MWPLPRTRAGGLSVSMTFLDTLAGKLGFQRSDTMPEGVRPPARSGGNVVTVDTSMGLIPVYRNIQILGTAASQISIDQKRTYGKAIAVQDQHSLVKRPCLDMSRSDFIEQTVFAMATSGNGFWRIHRVGAGKTDAVANLEPLNPHEVAVNKDPETGGLSYSWRGRILQRHEVKHLTLMQLPGATYGLGPIQAARVELAGSLDLQNYASNWFNGTGQPDGILTSDQPLSKSDADQYRETWYGADENTPGGKKGIKVLGKGTTYAPIFLKPADAQFLESQGFTIAQLARLFGIPASLALAAIEGGSQTYANVAQDWLAFYRFTLMAYLRKIEEALSDLLPNGSVARFNVESLLRLDTKTRYEGYEIAIRSKWLAPSEVRSIEDRDPFTAEQLAELAALQSAPDTAKATA